MAESKKKFDPTFENGGFWEYYKDLERQFEDFLVYVPYLDKNEEICSFRLVNILLGICSHIDSAIKEIAFYDKFNEISKWKKIRETVVENRAKIEQGKIPTGPSFKKCLEALESTYCISTKEVTFKRLPERQKIKPYKPFNQKTQTPFWWDIYNHNKHDLHEYFEKATLKQTRDALAGAFLLNVIHEPASLRLFDYGLLKPKYGQEGFEIIYPTFKSHDIYPETPKGELENPFTIETPLFIYDYENEKMKKPLGSY
jgi:hypothetical protein